MGEDESKENWHYFKEKVKKHWIYAIIVIGACITAYLCGFILIRDIVVDTIVGEMSIANLQDFSTGSLFGTTLWIFFMYFVVIGLPTFGFLGALTAGYWYLAIPEEEQADLKEHIKSQEKKDKERKKWKERHGAQAGGFGGIIGLAMIIKIAVDGNWLVTFENLNVLYFLNVWLVSVFWLTIIFGIPMLIAFTIAILYKKK